MVINSRIQREGDVFHLVAQQLFDLTSDLSGLADRDEMFRLPTGRGEGFAHETPAVRIRATRRIRLSPETCSCPYGAEQDQCEIVRRIRACFPLFAACAEKDILG